MRKQLLFGIFSFLGIILFNMSLQAQIYTTNFEISDNWSGGTWTGYNEKSYTDAEGGWLFNSTSAVRGETAESFGGSSYSFRDRDEFSVTNTSAITGISGFSLQLRDWMISGGRDRDLKISYNAGDSFETIATINKDWFDDYQVYQEFVFMFPDGVQDFDANQFQIIIDNGINDNSGRINIGSFSALGAETQVSSPVISPASGTFFEAINVSITTTTAGATVLWSLESQEGPWTEYEEAFSLSFEDGEHIHLWAKATKDDLEDSEVSHREYIFVETLLFKDFEDNDLLSGGWELITLNQEANTWGVDQFGGNKYARITEDPLDEDNPQYPNAWLISPAIDMSGMEVAELNFKTQAAFRFGDALTVKYSENYTPGGNVDDADWHIVDAVLDAHQGTGFGAFTSSGSIFLDNIDNSFHLAFHYEADADNLGRWHVDDIFILPLADDNTKLASFNVGGQNVLELAGVEVDDINVDAGAELGFTDFSAVQGISFSAVHPNADVTVWLNDEELEHANLSEQLLAENDVIVVMVAAPDGDAIGYYKVTLIKLVDPGSEFVLYKDFDDEDLLSGGWSLMQVSGSNTWNIGAFSGNYYARISDYNSDGFPDSWLISPAVNLSEDANYVFNFVSQNTHRVGEALKVKISTDYVDDVNAANWTVIEVALDPHTGPGFGTWTYSGDVSLDAFLGQQIFVAFHYQSDDNNKGQWHVDDIIIKEVAEDNADLALFKVGGKNALGLGGLVVENPETDEGAALNFDIFENVMGLELETLDSNASFAVQLNGTNVDEADFASLEFQEMDIILVTVTSADATTVKYYKLNLRSSGVATLAELRQGEMGSSYTYTGTAVVTFAHSNRNQRYIQDETAAILIDDAPGILPSSYIRGVGITNLKGTLTVHNAMLQFVPAEDPGAPVSAPFNIEPALRTLSQLDAAEQAMLVKVENVNFEDAAGAFATGQNYTLSDATGTGIFRTSFFSADYIEDAIPTVTFNLVAILSEHNGTLQLTARDWNDFSEADEDETNVNDLENTLQLFPNPFTQQLNFTNLSGVNEVLIFNALGQMVAHKNVSSNAISVNTSDYESGLYFVRLITHDGQQINRKLIKK